MSLNNLNNLKIDIYKGLAKNISNKKAIKIKCKLLEYVNANYEVLSIKRLKY